MGCIFSSKAETETSLANKKRIEAEERQQELRVADDKRRAGTPAMEIILHRVDTGEHIRTRCWEFERIECLKERLFKETARTIFNSGSEWTVLPVPPPMLQEIALGGESLRDNSSFAAEGVQAEATCTLICIDKGFKVQLADLQGFQTMWVFCDENFADMYDRLHRKAREVTNAKEVPYGRLRRTSADGHAETLHIAQESGKAVGSLLQADDMLYLSMPEPTKWGLFSRYRGRQSSEDFTPFGSMTLKSKPSHIDVYMQWKDQGWGNRKGEIQLQHTTGGATYKCGRGLFGVAGHTMVASRYQLRPQNDEATCAFFAAADAGTEVQFQCKVGGGGGHELNIDQFDATAHY